MGKKQMLPPLPFNTVFTVPVKNGQGNSGLAVGSGISFPWQQALIAQQAAVNSGATIDSPDFTGIPIAPTAPPLTNNQQLATTQYSDAAVAVEKGRATTAEAANASAISTETTRAQAAEVVNANAISAETTRATAAEGLLAPKANPIFTGIATAPEFNITGVTAATATAGAATLPANPTGFVLFQVGGLNKKIAFYDV
jgi:hypothetical protein